VTTRGEHEATFPWLTCANNAESVIVPDAPGHHALLWTIFSSETAPFVLGACGAPDWL